MRVLTLGTFDLFHVGHLRLLQRAAQHGQLWVGVNSDSFVTEYKGRPPVVPEYERFEIVQAIRGVSAARLNDGPGFELIEDVRPGCLAVGSDWHQKPYLDQIGVTQEWLDERGIAVLYLTRTAGVSTTMRRAAL